MSWQDILKEMDAEEELERDSLRRDIEAERYSESYEKPSFKKVEEKLRQLINLTIPQDMRMLEFITRQGFKHPELTRQKLNSALKKAYQAERELEKIKKEAKQDELIDEVFEDSDSEYATDRGFQMLMSNEIDGVSLGFGINIASSVREYQQLFARRRL